MSTHKRYILDVPQALRRSYTPITGWWRVRAKLLDTLWCCGQKGHELGRLAVPALFAQAKQVAATVGSQWPYVLREYSELKGLRQGRSRYLSKLREFGIGTARPPRRREPPRVGRVVPARADTPPSGGIFTTRSIDEYAREIRAMSEQQVQRAAPTEAPLRPQIPLEWSPQPMPWTMPTSTQVQVQGGLSGSAQEYSTRFEWSRSEPEEPNDPRS